MSSYFGSHSGGGKVRVTNSSDLLRAIKIQTISHPNQSNPKSRVITANHTNPVETQVQFNSVAQQINYGVKHSQNFKPIIPTAPSILAVTAQDRSIRITWNAPSSNGGAAITAYTVKAKRVSPSGSDIIQVFENALQTQIFTGLTNGNTYKFSVAAINSAGVSDYSADSAVVSPAAGQPGAPTDVTVAAGEPPETRVDVSWTAPADNGGSAITKYTVFAYRINPDPLPGPVSSQVTTPGSPAATTHTYTGLTKGATYQFRVAAWTSAPGANPSTNKSGLSASIIPCGATNQPGAPQGSAGDSCVSLYWTEPSDLNGSEVDYYRVEVLDSAGDPLDPPRIDDTSPGTLTYIVRGLDNGTGYRFKVLSVTKTNGYLSSWGGIGPALIDDPITPTPTPSGTIPTAPTGLTADYVGLDPLVGKGVHLSWQEPSTGTPDRYVVLYRTTAEEGAYWAIKYVGGNTTECEIKDGDISPAGLTIDIPNGTQYDYVVYAEVTAGPGPYSDPVTFAAATTPVWNPRSGNVEVTKSGVGELAVSWDAAVSVGTPVTEYKLYVSLSGDPVLWTTLSGISNSYTIENLLPTLTYVWLTAVNAVGESDYTDPGIVETPLEQAGDYKPLAPVITSVKHYKNTFYGDLGAELTFTRTDTAPGNITYTATATPLDPELPPVIVSPFSLIAGDGYIRGLTAGQQYTFAVRETLDGVDSDESAPWPTPLLISDIPAQITDAPTIDTVGDGEVTISWVAPSSDAPITGYTIGYFSPGTADGPDVGPESTTATISGLNNGTPYVFKVRATNDVSTELQLKQEFSPISEIAVPGNQGGTEIAPDTPLDSPGIAAVGDRQITLSWNFLRSSGSLGDVPSPIIGYNVYYKLSTEDTYTLYETVPSFNSPLGSSTVSGLENNTPYDFVYTVLNGNPTTNESEYSPDVAGTPVPSFGYPPPGPPSNLTLTIDPTAFFGFPGWVMAWDPPEDTQYVENYSLTYYVKNEDGSMNNWEYTALAIDGTQYVTAADFGGAINPYGIYQYTVWSVGPGGNSPGVTLVNI